MKLIDYILIFCVALSVFFLSGFLYVGSPEQFELMKQNLPFNIAKRTIIFGLVGTVLLFGLRFLFYALFGDSKTNPSSKYLILTSLVLGILTALGGSLFFFSN